MKTIFVASLLTLAVTVLPRDAMAGVSLILGEDITAPECPLTIPIEIRGAEASIPGVQLDILYPSALFTFQNCTMASGVAGNVDAAVTTVVPPPLGKTRLRVILRSDAFFTDGQLATCTFTTATGAAEGSYDILADLPVASGPTGGQEGVAAFSTSATIVAPSGCCP